MLLPRKLAPLLTAAVGAFALMIPVPTPGTGTAEFSPLPPIAMFASAETTDNDDATMAAVREQASAALMRLQGAAKQP
jgi:hypothetical protein